MQMDLKETGVDSGKEDMLIPVDSEVSVFCVFDELGFATQIENKGIQLEQEVVH